MQEPVAKYNVELDFPLGGAAVRRCVQPQPFWQARYYDFNVWSEQKRVEKLRYIHRYPVKRGLVERPGDWLWSSFHHYLTGEEGVVEIESHWTATRRESREFIPPFGDATRPKSPAINSATARGFDEAQPSRWAYETLFFNREERTCDNCSISLTKG
jgi:hypothetical protein